MIGVKEDKQVGTIDISNFFIQTLLYRRPGEKKIRIKINGVLLAMLIQMDLVKYGLNIVYEKGKKLLYLWDPKVIYVMLQSSLFSYINMEMFGGGRL